MVRRSLFNLTSSLSQPEELSPSLVVTVMTGPGSFKFWVIGTGTETSDSECDPTKTPLS